MAPVIALIRLDLAGAVVADHGEDLAGIEIEIGMVQGRDAAIALDQAAGVQEGSAIVRQVMPTPF